MLAHLIANCENTWSALQTVAEAIVPRPWCQLEIEKLRCAIVSSLVSRASWFRAMADIMIMSLLDYLAISFIFTDLFAVRGRRSPVFTGIVIVAVVYHTYKSCYSLSRSVTVTLCQSFNGATVCFNWSICLLVIESNTSASFLKNVKCPKFFEGDILAVN
jgi:hypothetical protein